MKKFFVLLLFTFSGSLNFLLAQEIDPDNFDRHLLERLVKLKIDSVRKALNLEALSNDSLLYLAALDQAEYLLKRKEIGHEQPGRKKHTPMDRAHYYKADFPEIGENVERIFYLVNLQMPKVSKKPVFIKTYQEAAYELAEGWVHSPPHYKNIRHKEFDITGVAVSADEKNKSITAVQVFGMSKRN